MLQTYTKNPTKYVLAVTQILLIILIWQAKVCAPLHCRVEIFVYRHQKHSVPIWELLLLQATAYSSCSTQNKCN
jgi:hypothetical protein